MDDELDPQELPAVAVVSAYVPAMARTAKSKARSSYDPLLDGRRDADPRLRDARGTKDPNAGFLGEQAQGTPGNESGPELALYRVVRWLTNRRSR